MKKLIYIILIFLINRTLLQTQEETEPENPDLIIPEVILEIEDLSVEHIEAALPPEDELLPLEREIPLPQEGGITIEEPGIELILPDTDKAVSSNQESSYITEVIAGAGIVNDILCKISFYKLGTEPLLKIFYNHETLDGFAFKPIGQGYNLREDQLGGYLKLHLGDFALQTQGNFKEIERGLQEQSIYYSVMNRFINGGIDITISPVETFSLFGSVGTDIANFYLTGAETPAYELSYPPTEFIFSSVLKGEFQWPAFTVGLSADYKYKNLFGSGQDEFQRIRADLNTGFEFIEWLNIQARIGYYTSTELQHLVPFEVFLYGYPLSWLTISAGGGFNIEEYDLRTILERFQYIDITQTIIDNPVWFGRINTQISMENIILLNMGFALSHNSYFPVQGTENNEYSGLFPLLIEENIFLAQADFDIRFNIARWFYINWDNSIFYPLREEISPRGTTGLEVVITEEEGVFGTELSVLTITDFIHPLYPPLLEVGGFYQVSENVKLILEVQDLLYPLLEQVRYSIYPFISPGILAHFKVQINF